VSSAPTCSVIILNWNGLSFLGPCLEALQRQTFRDFEIVLVDNASTDGSPEWVTTHYPDVRLVANKENLGFTGGNNAGFAVAQGEFQILLNNDTEVAPTFLEKLVEAALQDERVGMVASVLVFAHRPEYINSAGIQVHWDGVGLDYLTSRPVSELPPTPVEVFGPSGGAGLYRRAMLEEVGTFHPEFFIYVEDVDLAWRGQLAGWRCMLAPQAIVRHVYSATMIKKSPRKMFLLARNRLLTLFLNLPTGLWLRYGAFILAYDLAACAYGLATGDHEIVRGRLEALKMVPSLRSRRRVIQRQRKVPLRELTRLLSPPLAPWTTLRLRREIDRLAQHGA
jgi:GT2 family glycosyltransferase